MTTACEVTTESKPGQNAESYRVAADQTTQSWVIAGTEAYRQQYRAMDVPQA